MMSRNFGRFEEEVENCKALGRRGAASNVKNANDDDSIKGIVLRPEFVGRNL